MVYSVMYRVFCLVLCTDLRSPCVLGFHCLVLGGIALFCVVFVCDVRFVLRRCVVTNCVLHCVALIRVASICVVYVALCWR